MSPEAFAARGDAASICQNLVNYFGQSKIRDIYHIDMEGDMPGEETLNLNVHLLDLEKKEQIFEEKIHPTLCFPPGFIPTPGLYAPQVTDLIEQMAGTKRSREGEDASAPIVKRRGATSSRGGKNNNLAKSLSKSGAKRGRGRPRKEKQVFIDLSGEEEDSDSGQMQSAKAIMKALPPSSITGEFPRFKEGEVYIIIDSNNITYQYQLHKAVLSRMSPMLAKLLQVPSSKEAMIKLKIAATDAEFRIEINYSHTRGLWMLSRAPFTTWKQAETFFNMVSTEEISKVSVLPSGFKSDIMLPDSQDTLPIDIVKARKTLPPSSILSSGIGASEITITNVAKDAESDFSEIGDAKLSSPANGEAAPVENLTQLGSTEDGKFDATADSISVNPEVATQISVDQTLINLEAVADVAKHHLANVEADPDQSAIFPDNLEDENTPKLVEDFNIPIPSASQEGPQILETISELGSVKDNEETSPLMSDNTSPRHPAAESEKIDDNPTTEAEKDNLSVDQSSSALNGVHPSIETNPDQDLGKQDARVIPNPITPSRPPTEISEAYNNLFLIFYSKPPIISNNSISIALGQCDTLVAIADRLKCLPVVRPYLANAFGQFGKQLYLAITAEPFRWLQLSMILKSSAIYKESMIHIVGAYIPGPVGQAKLLQDMPNFVRELILFKVRQLDQQRMDVNERLFSSSITVDSKIVTFSFADKSTLSTWLVVQIWRDWFGRNIALARLDPAKTGALYRTIAKSGDAYLPIAEVKAAIEEIRHPTQGDLDEIQEDLGLLKNFARMAVENLCKNNGMLDLHEAGVSYLTCTRISDEELPWFTTAE